MSMTLPAPGCRKPIRVDAHCAVHDGPRTDCADQLHNTGEHAGTQWLYCHCCGWAFYVNHTKDWVCFACLKRCPPLNTQPTLRSNWATTGDTR